MYLTSHFKVRLLHNSLSSSSQFSSKRSHENLPHETNIELESLPSMPVPHVERDQADGQENADARDGAHADEEGKVDRPQDLLHDRPVLRHFSPDPSLHVAPREVVALRIKVAQFHVFAIDDLLDLREGDAISLRAEGHVALREEKRLALFIDLAFHSPLER